MPPAATAVGGPTVPPPPPPEMSASICKSHKAREGKGQKFLTNVAIPRQVNRDLAAHAPGCAHHEGDFLFLSGFHDGASSCARVFYTRIVRVEEKGIVGRQRGMEVTS